MGALLKKILDIVLNGSIKKTLIGAGLTVSSGAISFTIINYYINKLISSLNNISIVGDLALALFNLGGFDDFISIIIGAYIVKFTLKKSQVFLSKV